MANENPPYALKDQDYLDLWKFFSEDAAKVKDKLWTIASWLYALMGALLGLIVKYYIEHPTAPFLLPAMGLVGLLLSVYSAFMIREYGAHIRTGWNRTNFLRSKIASMENVWQAKDILEKKPDKKKGWIEGLADMLLYNAEYREIMPPFAKRLELLAWSYGVLFLGVSLYLIISS